MRVILPQRVPTGATGITFTGSQSGDLRGPYRLQRIGGKVAPIPTEGPSLGERFDGAQNLERALSRTAPSKPDRHGADEVHGCTVIPGRA